MADGTTEVVVLDVNETLFPLDPIRDRLEAVGIGAGALDLWFARVLRDGFAVTVTGGLASFPDLARHHLRAMARAAGVDDPGAATEEVIAGFGEVVPHDDVAPAFERLRSGGIRLATLTNGTAAITRGLLDRAGLADHVEAVLEASDAGIWKPHADAYRYALSELGVDAPAAALVAVHPWDVHGAADAGMVGAWVNRDGADYPTFLRAPAITGSSLVEVADALTSDAATLPT